MTFYAKESIAKPWSRSQGHIKKEQKTSNVSCMLKTSSGSGNNMPKTRLSRYQIVKQFIRSQKISVAEHDACCNKVQIGSIINAVSAHLLIVRVDTRLTI